MIFYFHLPYFHVSDSALVLHNTLVLSFYIDVVLTLSASIGDEIYCEPARFYYIILALAYSRWSNAGQDDYNRMDVYIEACYIARQITVLTDM